MWLKEVISCIFLSTILSISANEVYENSYQICKRCQCQNLERQFVLDCTRKDMHHTISNWPKHDNKTLRASFSRNSITTLEPLPSTDASVMVKLDHCSIAYLKPGLFENMKNVLFVDLSYNLITNEELASEKFKGPFNKNEFEPIELRYLDLSYNIIHSIPQSLFEHTPRLEHLNLEGNLLHIIDLQTEKAFSSIPNLQYLNLANNSLRELTMHSLINLTKLREINLSKNQLGSIPDYALAYAPDLKTLRIDENPIAVLSSDAFEYLPSLVELSLNNLKYLETIPEGLFKPLKNLKTLTISESGYLKEIKVGAFGLNQTLKEFYIENNKLWDISYDLLDWSKLEVFKFKGNSLRCSCNLYQIVQKLQRRNRIGKNGPYCIGDMELNYQVFNLKSNICDENYIAHNGFQNLMERKFSFVKVVLITISLVAVTSSFIIVGLCYSKHKKYGISQYAFTRTTPVLYNPLVTSPHSV